jgi:DNA-directed RNA polymerase subunit RPC12/RpoP
MGVCDMLLFDCPMCGARYDVDNDLADTVVRCRECDEPARVLAPPHRERPTPQAAPSESSASRPSGSVEFHCQECNACYEVNAELAGKTVKCRDCGELQMVLGPNYLRKRVPVQPTHEQAVEGKTQTPTVISFHCPGCLKEYRVPADAAGKRAKCPACGQPLLVPTSSVCEIPSDLLEALAEPELPTAPRDSPARE